jgi:CheY-like chemotaxis protein
MSNKKILIVDDDADTLPAYHVLLTAHHYDTVRAGAGVSAVREALEHQPDLIILDLALPAADGFDVLEWFRGNKQLAAIPVVVAPFESFACQGGVSASKMVGKTIGEFGPFKGIESNKGLIERLQ